LKTPKPTAKLRRAQSSSQIEMYIRRINAMNVPFKFQTARLKANETTLIDSGVTENFIDEDTWKRLGIGKNQLHEWIILTNVNGTENRRGELTHFCWLRVSHQGKEALLKFFLTALGRDRLILGYPFLSKFKPKVNWRKGTMEGDLTIQSAAFKYLGKYMAKIIRKAIKQHGQPGKDEAIYLRKVSISQEMAHKFGQKAQPIILPSEVAEFA
jgi:hypothetical protein